MARRCRGCDRLFEPPASRGRPRAYCSECRPGQGGSPPIPEDHEHSWTGPAEDREIGGVRFVVDLCPCGQSRARRPGVPRETLDGRR